MGWPAIEERDGPRGRERRCTVNEAEECEGWAPLEDFPETGDGMPRAFCKLCSRARKRRYYADGRFTKNAEVERRRNRTYAARHKERKRRQHREYMARVKADPEKHERYLEARRMAYRLKREREGAAPRPARRHPDRTMIPAAPLAALIGRIVDERRLVADLIDDPSFGRVEEVCRDLGVATRLYRRWRSGEYADVTVAVAEGIILAADLEPADVYTPGDHREALARLEAIPVEEVEA